VYRASFLAIFTAVSGVLLAGCFPPTTNPPPNGTKAELLARLPLDFDGNPVLNLVVDPPTRRLFVWDNQKIYVVNLLDEDVEERVSTVPFDMQPDGIMVDAQRRRLYIATFAGTIESLNLDSFERLGSTGDLGVQIQWMALDLQRNRLAVNINVTLAGQQSRVLLIDLSTMRQMSFDLALEEGMSELPIAIDPVGNQLLVVRRGDSPGVEFYKLPG
jgi:hypothetical protein